MHVTYRKVAFVVNHNMTSLSSRLRPNDALRAYNFSNKRGLILVHIHWHIRLIPIRFGLQKVLGLLTRCQLKYCGAGSNDTGTSCQELLGIVHSLNDYCNLLGLFCRKGYRR
jgi:hypothetical protein